MMHRVMAGSSKCSVVLVLLLCVGSISSCRTWFYRPDGKECVCGDAVGGIISCLNLTGDVGILNSFCLTSNSVDDNTSVVGRCLFILNHGQVAAGTDGLYIKVYPDISEQDNQTCGYLNRQGRLCGSCREHHYVSAYSYDLKCYHCTSGLMSNIVKYLLVAYLPLTLFFVFVILFRISVTSPKMNTVVFTCQLFSTPTHMRYLMQFSRNLSGLAAVKTLATVYGVWNLDFFRTLIPPICLPLHTLQILTLDYLIAIYPLFLVVCFYVLLSVYDRGYGPVLWLCKPFHRVMSSVANECPLGIWDSHLSHGTQGIPWDCTTFPSHLSIPSHCTMGQGDPMYHETRGSHGIVPQSHPTFPSRPTVPWDKGIPWDCTNVPWLGQPSHLSIPSHCTMGQGDPMGLYQCPMAGAAIPPVHPVPLYHGTRGSHGTVPMSHGWCSHPTCPSRPTVPLDKGIPWDCTNVPWLGQPSHLSIPSHCTMGQGDPMGLYQCPMAGAWKCIQISSQTW